MVFSTMKSYMVQGLGSKNTFIICKANSAEWRMHGENLHLSFTVKATGGVREVTISVRIP